jgi:hypothetical protein
LVEPRTSAGESVWSRRRRYLAIVIEKLTI